MNINYKKLDRQNIGVDKWFNSSEYGSTKNCRGTFDYYTGVGKTYAAILVMKRLLLNDSKHSIVVLVPANVIDRWKVEIINNFNKKQQNNINVYTPHHISNNNIRIKTNTLIVDELHEYYSEEFIKIINTTYIQFDNNLGLTATYVDSKNRHRLIEDLYPVIDRIDEKEAIREGYVSSYVEFNLRVELSEIEKLQYTEYTDIISKTINKFGRGGLDLATKCLSGGKHFDGKIYTNMQFVYGYATSKGWRKNLDLSIEANKQIDDLWNPHKIFGYATSLVNAIRHRKNILYNCSTKIDVSLELCEKFNTYKTIIFSQSTNFADKINLLLNEQEHRCSVVYHSNLDTIFLPSEKTGKLIKYGKTRLKRQAIEYIKNGKARIICTASSLDKGFDVSDLTLAITASGTSNFTQYKQRGGRVKRKNLFNDDKVALLINLYVGDSKEEDWLKKRQSQSDHKIYWIDSIDDISFNPVEKDDININDI